MNSGNARLEAKSGNAVWDWIEIAVVTKKGRMFIPALAVEGAETARKYKLPVSIMIAQACLESSFGMHPRAVGHNSLFGITKREELSKGKERDWYPQCQKIVPSPTKVEREVEVNGKKIKKLVTVQDRFCGASSYKEAIEIWGQYVTGHPNSRQIAHIFKDGPWSEVDLKVIADHMPKIGFGSRLLGDYGQELMNIINEYGLQQYDPK